MIPVILPELIEPKEKPKPYTCSESGDQRRAKVARIVNALEPNDIARIEDSAAHLCDGVAARRNFNTGFGPSSAQELILKLACFLNEKGA